ncbi:MAG TPA: c-type cytochrome [Gemmatimonadales bacterium]
MTFSVSLLALCLCLGACKRGAAGSESQAPAAPVPDSTRGAAAGSSAGVQPGIHPQMLLGSRAARNPYAGDRSAIATGRQLFVGMNCAGCHSDYAGGAIGPSLRDSLWIYGNQDAQIFSTIAEGRPNGMPAWAGRLPDDMIWRIVAYIKTLGTPAEPEKPPLPAPTQLREAPGSAGAGG